MDEVGKWTEDKLNILEKYLNAYTKIFKNQNFKGYHYIDAFAATGRHISKEDQRLIKGSPRIALSLKYPFTSYTFIEKDSKRVEKLKKLREEYSDRDIEIIQDDCNNALIKFIVPRIRYEYYERGFVFLDPYGLHVKMETIKNISETGALEVFVNFSIMAYNRTMGVSNPQEDNINRMHDIMGDSEWRNEITSVQYTLNLTEEADLTYLNKHWKNLVTAYKKRLQKIFKFVSTPLYMTNTKNAPLYALIFAGHNETGKEIMENIINKHTRGK